MKNCLLVSLLSLSMGVNTLHAQGKFSGDMIGEFYYVAQHHSNTLVGLNGFWFRKISFAYKKPLTEKIAVKLKLETASPGDFITKDNLIPCVKDALISFKENDYKIRFGIQSPPTFAKVEALWGYRSLEKTPVDLQKWSSSRDFGLSLTKKGDFFSFALMFGNSSSNKSETDKGKRMYASLGFTPVEALYVEIYGDYNGLLENNNKQYLVHGFVSYKTTSFRTGLLYSRKGSLNDSTSNNLVSCYAVYSLKEGLDFILRYDKTMEANTKGANISYIPFSSTSPANFVLTGISYTISNKVQIMPNVKFVYYDSTSVSYDLYPNLTLYYKF